MQYLCCLRVQGKDISKIIDSLLQLLSVVQSAICDRIKILGDSVSCQFADIRSHRQLSNEQKRYISKQHVRDWCISKQTRLIVRDLPQEKHLALEKRYAHG